MTRRALLGILLCAAVAGGCAGSISFESATPKTPERVEGRLVTPDGPGSFTALVLLHGCHGVSPQVYAWARWLADRGYVAFVVDSFGPRNEPVDCKDDPSRDPLPVINGPPLERARARGVVLPPVGFAAAVAMYPGGCRDYAKELVVRPLLLLIAGSDDWTPPRYCREMGANVRARGADVTRSEE